MNATPPRMPGLPRTLADFVDPRTTALLLWDLQKGLAGRAFNTAEVQANARRLIAAADHAGVPVIWSRHVLPPLHLTSPPFLLFLMKKQKVDDLARLAPTMQPGMEETEFLDGFAPAAHHLVIEKSQPSFFVDTPLDLRLKSLGVRTVVLAGVATDIGIEFTARHAQAKGFFAVIAEDATGSYTREAHERSLAFMRAWMPVAGAAGIAAIWNGTA